MSDKEEREEDSSSPHAAAMDEPQEEFISPEAVPSHPEKKEEKSDGRPPGGSP